MDYVIIGNSAAAVGCIEGIRQIDRTGSITVIGEEPFPVYSRPLISYLLAGKTDENRMHYRPDNFYEKNGCRLMTGTLVTAIQPDRKTVSLVHPGKRGGSTLSYDRLLVATGSRPFVPPIPGLDKVKKSFTFQSLEDARALGRALESDCRVLILGAGLIGLKCAEGIAGRAGSITIADLADRVLPSVLDPHAAAMVQSHLESHGLQFRLSRSVREFTPSEAILSDGETIPFDVLVVATGVRPNSELVSQAGGRVGKGICTDAWCRTTLPDVYAAGDCAESHDIAADRDGVLALLPNAYMQGECAGINMAGGDRRYDRAIPMNAVGFFGLHILTAGCQEGESTVDQQPGVYKKLTIGDNRLKGFIMVGDVARAGIYTSLIRERTPLDTLDFEQIRRQPQLMAFSRADRERMLAQAH